MTDAHTDRAAALAWFRQARWGVCTHYLGELFLGGAGTAEAWNQLVDDFDVEGLAAQLAACGAPYYIITIGQTFGYYCAPNTAYDAITGVRPSKCARRDLIADLHAALEPHGIKLLVYCTTDAPYNDPAAAAAFQYQQGPYRNAVFLRAWEQVISEWSRRWGEKVFGWWFDGCFWPDEMFGQPEAPNFATFAAAARAGNPNSIISFNPGSEPVFRFMTEHEDYTAGETDFTLLIGGRWPSDWAAETPSASRGGLIRPAGPPTQLHTLTFLGEWWGAGTPRFPVELMIGYTKHVNAWNGIITWDVPIQANGLLPAAFVEQLIALHAALVKRIP